MNYYEGQTLGAYAEGGTGTVQEPEALYIIHQVLDGLETTHEEGEDMLTGEPFEGRVLFAQAY